VLEVSLVRELREVPGLAVRREEPISRHAAWRVGGPVELWLVAETEDALTSAATLLAKARVRLTVVEGDRLLIRDGGLDGALMRPGGFAERLSEMTVGALAPAAILGRRGSAAGWRGMHKLMLRSGTVGEAFRDGALEHVKSVRVLKGRKVAELAPADVREHHGLLGFTLDPPLALGTSVLARGRETIARRRKGGPGLAGRLMNDSGRNLAAGLMRDANLDGVRVRSARIGTVEPNSVLNLGGATTKDILLLTKMVQDRVKKHSGSRLQPHLKPLGRNKKR
jgi:UDP-N-acetylmuramate dehydrogenase